MRLYVFLFECICNKVYSSYHNALELKTIKKILQRKTILFFEDCGTRCERIKNKKRTFVGNKFTVCS